MVEGAQPPVVGALFGQGHIGGDHVHDIQPAAEFVNELIRYGHGLTSLMIAGFCKV